MMPGDDAGLELVARRARALGRDWPATVKVSGSAPYLSELARSLASSWVKVRVPVISARPPVIGCSLVGAESTSPSSTIASWCRVGCVGWRSAW